MTQHIHLDAPHSLHDLIRGAMSRSPFLDGRQLKIDVQPEAVVISGVVGTYYQKQMAQELIRPLLGNMALQNQVEVIRRAVSV